MTREIKFRIWDEQGGEMREGYPVIETGKFDSFVEDITGSCFGVKFYPLFLINTPASKTRTGWRFMRGILCYLVHIIMVIIGLQRGKKLLNIKILVLMKAS